MITKTAMKPDSPIYAQGVEADIRCSSSCAGSEGPFIEPAVKKRGGGPRPRTATEKVAHFWSRITRGEGCWLWQGGCTPDGYGLVQRGRRPDGRIINDYAHRIAYWLTHGPIADGKVIRHSCDNPPCCNPAHLLIGWQADNIEDARRQGKYNRPRPGRWSVPAAIRAAAINAREYGELAAIAREHGYSVVHLAVIRRRALARVNDHA